MALLTDSTDDLVALWGMIDAVALKHGLLSNATKTEVMAVGRLTLLTFQLSGQELRIADSI
eukprot:364515-Chlamydomonas_euryale.AAC.13